MKELDLKVINGIRNELLELWDKSEAEIAKIINDIILEHGEDILQFFKEIKGDWEVSDGNLKTLHGII